MCWILGVLGISEEFIVGGSREKRVKNYIMMYLKV